MTLSRPYPSRIAELERENAMLRAEVERLTRQRDLAEEAEDAAKRLLHPEVYARRDRLMGQHLPPTRAEEQERE